MKLTAAIAIYVAMGLILAAGCVLVLAGKPWLLLVGLLAYIIAMYKIGCSQH